MIYVFLKMQQTHWKGGPYNCDEREWNESGLYKVQRIPFFMAFARSVETSESLAVWSPPAVAPAGLGGDLLPREPGLFCTQGRLGQSRCL